MNISFVKKYLKLLFGIFLGGLFLFFMMRHANWHHIFEIFKTANFFGIFASFLLLVLSLLFRAERWYLILKPHFHVKSAKRRPSYDVFFLGMGANALLPFRLGDIARGTLFSSYLDLAPIKTLTALFLEKLFDLLVICSIGFVMFTFFPIQESKFLKIGANGLAYIVILLLIILLSAHYLRHPIVYFLGRLKKSFPVLIRLIAFVESQMHHVCDALSLINTGKNFLLLLFYSLATWFAEACACYAVALSLPSLPHPMASWAAMPIAVLSTALPSAPGGIGTFDFFAERIMKLWDNPANASIAYAFMIHIIILIVPVFLALVSVMGNSVIISCLVKKDKKT